MIRQALELGLVDELTIIVAPVVLGGGKRLFEGFTKSVELEQLVPSARTRKPCASTSSNARFDPGCPQLV